MNSIIRAAKLDKSMRVLGRSHESRDTAPSRGDAVAGGVAAESFVNRAISDVGTFHPDQSVITESVKPSATGYCEDGSGNTDGQRYTQTQPMPTIDDLRKVFADELHALREEATEQGYKEGLVSARAEIEKQYSDELRKLQRTEAQLADSLQQGIGGLTEVGAEIVFEAVTKIIGCSYIDRSGVVDVVREVVRQAKDRSRLLIRINPADYAELVTARDQFTENQNVQSVDFAADDRIELGGCLLETPSGNLDGRLEVQLQQLRDTLMSARYRHTESVIEP